MGIMEFIQWESYASSSPNPANVVLFNIVWVNRYPP